MKFSEKWLREWVSPSASSDELVAKLTMAGLEVDAVEPASEQFSGVIVGEIDSVEAHPDAEKLRVCQVSGHPQGTLQVVCGAPNARPGIKVPFATIGALLPGDVKIKKAKLRGVESNGMLCGDTELALGDDDSGLWELPGEAPVGEDLREWLELDDNIIEVDLTPNRSDCLSIRGIAREVGVLTNSSVTEPKITCITSKNSADLPVALEAGEACPVYVGRVIKNIRVDASTPLWLVEKLRRSGIRSIDPVVDVTNYVLLELGQPMHAFDLNKIDGGIVVRMANDGEEVVLLNEQKMTLRQDTLVIADHSSVLAIAGVMGGLDSAVSKSTQDIFLESAFFAPRSLAGAARSYGLHTDSSHRFERGVDYQLQITAVERATQLLLEIVGGEPGEVIVKKLEDKLPKQKSVTLSKHRLATALSIQLEDDQVVNMMQRLGLTLTSSTSDQWEFDVPSYRFDIEIEEDLIEEVARIYGYDRLPSRSLMFATELQKHSETKSPLAALKSILVSRGYQEIITYSFIDPKLHEKIFAEQEAVVLRNPISADMANMRTSLLPGLLSSLSYNLNRQQNRARLFEAGMVFQPGGKEPYRQENRVAGLVYGSVRQQGWSEKVGEADFFDIKGDVEAFLSGVARGREISFAPLTDTPHLHPGQTASITVDGQRKGFVGALHPLVAKKLDLNRAVWLFECELDGILEADLPKFQPLSRYPEVSRDIAIVVDKAVYVADIEKAIRKVAGDVLKELKLFDVYSGEGIDPKRKSLAFSLIFQLVDRTLTDEEVNALMEQVVSRLEADHGANLR